MRKPKPLKTTIGGRDKRSYLAFTILFPLFLFLATEFLLRLLGYGPDLSLFRTEEIGGRTFHIMNPSVKARYFSRVRFNPMTSLDYFSVPKHPNTFRVFCLGASTTAGYPYGYVGSFSTFLEDRLSATFPHKVVEVINLGLTATNTFTTLDFANELVDYEPDLLIVYDGHNEFYGALGAASNESAAGPRWMIKLYLTLVHSKVFLLLRDAYNGIPQLFFEPDSGSMMERLALGQYVPYESSTYSTAREKFLSNMEDIITLCRTRQIPLILSSQVSNLRNQKPLVGSPTRPEPNGETARAWQRGIAFLDNNMLDSAATSFHIALTKDSLNADVRYDLARCEDRRGKKAEALEEYKNARDFDQLRFRMSGDFNIALRHLAQSHDIPFAEIENAFQSASPDSIVGSELLLEHVHPNARGYFLMASEYASLMERHGLLGSIDEWRHASAVNEDSLWQTRRLTSLDERAALRRTEILLSSWPFREHDQTVPGSSDRIGIIIDQMLNGSMAWEQAHVAAAEHYEALGKLPLAEREYDALVRMIPVNVSPYLRLARLYLKQLKYDPARAILLNSISVEPTVYAYRALGAISVDTGKQKDAVTYLEHAVRLSVSASEKTESGYLLALAYGRAGMIDRASEQVQQVLRIDPNFHPARELLQKMNRGLSSGN